MIGSFEKKKKGPRHASCVFAQLARKGSGSPLAAILEEKAGGSRWPDTWLNGGSFHARCKAKMEKRRGSKGEPWDEGFGVKVGCI